MSKPVAWIPITEPYPPSEELDILMGDGSVLCEVLPQADGDLWWNGSGTGERFIDPQYANVTHWRIHSETAATPNHHEALAASEASDAESIATYRRCRDDRDKLREVMQQALEALSAMQQWTQLRPSTHPWDAWQKCQPAIDALRAALGERDE